MHQFDYTERITNFFYKIHQVPLFTIQLDCCKMPPSNQIALVWRKNLHKMLNFLNLIETGIKGFVRDVNQKPIRSALIRVAGDSLVYQVTKNLAHFRIVLPEGAVTFEVSAEGYIKRFFPVVLNRNMIMDMGDVVLTSDGNNEPVTGIVSVVEEKSNDVKPVPANLKSIGDVSGKFDCQNNSCNLF